MSVSKFSKLAVSVSVAVASGLFAAQSVAEINMPEFYGSLRAEAVGSAEDRGLQDASSRIGIRFEQEVAEGVNFFARMEKGTAFTYGENATFFNRLGFIGASYGQFGSISMGKQWSPYYDVAGMTEAFMTNGGDASGTYGTLTNSTARSDNAVQYRNTFGPLKLALQAQNSDESSDEKGDVRFSAAYTGSISYSINDNITLAAAHTQANLKDNSAERGIEGDSSRSSIAGATVTLGQVKVAATYHDSVNHVKDNSGKFFAAAGAEVYAEYKANENLHYYTGYNYMAPKESADTQFTKSYAVFGANYNWSSSFQNYVHYSLENSTQADGEKVGDRVYFGGRFNF